MVLRIGHTSAARIAITTHHDALTMGINRPTICILISMVGTSLVASGNQDPILLIELLKQRSVMLMCPFMPNATNSTAESTRVMTGDVTTVASWGTLRGNVENQVLKLEARGTKVRIKRGRMPRFLLSLKKKRPQDLQRLSQVRSL